MSQPQQKQIEAAYELLLSSQKSLNNAKKILEEMLPTANARIKKLPTLSTKDLSSYSDADNKIVEWVFTGDSMLAADGNIYPVPHNYACKSHLVQGSKLKATIEKSGKILYKIILEIPHENKKGVLVESGWKFQVIAEGRAYHVLPASVTFLKAQVGDTLSIRIPAWKDATYGVPDALIPKSELA